MPFIYCTQCGYKNVFTTRQANFCSGCGQKLMEERKSNHARANSEQGEPSAERSGGIPNIDKLEYTVDLGGNSPTIGDIINTKEKGSEQKIVASRKKKNSKKLTIEEIEAQSLKECSSSINKSTN